MTSPSLPSHTTAAFYLQAAISFGVSLVAVGTGIAYLPVDSWVRAFLAVGTAAIVAYTVVFLALVSVLVLAARYIATRPPIARVLERWEHILFPLVLIVLGAVILIEGGAFGL